MPIRPHDLDLPAWGPYSKVYAGCSHLPDLESGLRIDASCFPGFYRGRLDIPNVLWESGYSPAEAAPDLSYWRFRHRLHGDAVRIDADWCAMPGGDGASARLLRAQCVNDSDAAQTFAVHVVVGLQPPDMQHGGRHGELAETLLPGEVSLSPGGAWSDARDFATRSVGRPTARDGLQNDGRTWREVRESGCAGGGYLWLEHPGDALAWRLDLPRALAGARIVARLRCAAGRGARLRLAGGGETAVHGTGQWQLVELGGRDCAAGSCEIAIVHAGPEQRVDLDLVAVLPADGTLAVTTRRWQFQPTIATGPRPDSRLLAWPDVPATYGLWWQGGCAQVREWNCARLDEFMRERTHDHVNPRLNGRGDGHWTEVLVGPVAVPARSSRDVFAVLAAGPRPAVERLLVGIDPAVLPGIHAAARAKRVDLAGNPAGAADVPAQQAMAACTLSNVVYPIYTRRRYVRHYSPGKWWDSLYTWDSGFVGLGLLEVAPDLARDCLEQYLMPEGDPTCAWLQHGTPLPVQVYLAHELWNRTRDRAALARAFPGLRQFHRFLCGRHGGSDTRRLASGLINTFRIFYNSGGWDDYAPQQHVHRHGLADRVAPMVNSSHAVRCARILARMAALLRIDGGEFATDAAELGAAIRTHAWDAEAGWFGYVLHDRDGRPEGQLRHESGANLNMGLDGVAPLTAGICDAEQERRLLAHVADPRELWTPYGVTTVSQAAPYYREDGYWNGTVWLAHQWFLWKTLLDLGQADLAWRIASTGLKVWREEHAISGNCYEHFPVAGGRGAGWHHFTSLSAPVLSWHGAYHRPGRITGGHELWLLDERWEGDAVRARLHLDGAPGRVATVLVCTRPGARRATWEGRPVPARERVGGCWEVELPAGGEGELVLA